MIHIPSHTIYPLLVATLAAMSTTGELSAQASARKPNIVYFMADELGYYELSCMGNPHLRTPNIDRMAAGGIRFTQALAGSAVCAPTRCCLMTGKHSGHTSVRSNGGGTPLREGEETVASVLRRAGYATGGFGKWGCGGRGSTGVPEKHGFDHFVGYYDQVHAHSYYPPYIVHNSEELVLPGNGGGRSGETYSHYTIMDAAKRFIRENRERPFFCYLPITPPHGMFDIPDDDPAWKVFAEKPWPEEARRYAAMVHMIDRNVGEVVELLSELGLEENTIFFFCGDNGGNDYFRDAEHPRGFHGPNVHPGTGQEFRGQKGRLYEGGLRIPMIVRWPGRIPAGRVSEHLWYFPDVLPTLAELAGGQAPGDIDGLSIVPELIGAQAAGRAQEQHEYLYWELGKQRALRAGSWKIVQPGSKAPWELYELLADPGEQRDLAAEQPERLAQLVALAEKAHEPVVEGVFHDRAIHEKDRRAKWGGARRKAPKGAVKRLPRKGLLKSTDWKLVSASSESRFNGKLARNAFDGDPRTIWHTEFQGGAKKHPHELIIDLGAERTVRGFRYLARQDQGWNGTIAKCEFTLAPAPGDFGTPQLSTSFRRTKEPQEIRCEPARGRYLRVRVLSEVGGGPWASIAELGVIGE